MTLLFWEFEAIMFLLSMWWAIREQRHMEATMTPWEIKEWENAFIANP